MIAVEDSVNSTDTLVDLFDAGESIRFMLKSFHNILWVLVRNSNGRTPMITLNLSKNVFERFGHL